MIRAFLPKPCAFADLKPSKPAEWITLTAAAAVLMVCSTAVTLSAQTVTTLLTFDGSNGSSQISGIVEGTDGNLYGTTEYGGTNNAGTAFKVTPEGTLTTIYDFCQISGCGGQSPMAGLVVGTDGNFYGTTFGGGTGSPCWGTVFKMTSQGALTTLYNFCSQAFGQLPQANLVQAADGNFYGTTYQGGSLGVGSVFKITPQGQLTTIHTFCSQPGCSDGSFPSGPGMMLGADGNLYGTTSQGGRSLGYGTVFKLTPAGNLTTLYAFCRQVNCADGRGPGALVQATNGTLYGTTYGGGSAGLCSTPDGCGTIFEITPAGKFTTLHSFCQEIVVFYCADGENPTSLTLGSDGNLYGTTQYGGIPQNGSLAIGSIFRLTPDGTLTTLHTFCVQTNCTDGAEPGNLVQHTDGSFFGATEGLTYNGYGTLFSLDDGLPPFVQTLRRFGKVGTPVAILGNNLSSTSSVSFNGAAAAFTVLSSNEITATVPMGATTGIVTVATDHGTLNTNVVFTVVP